MNIPYRTRRVLNRIGIVAMVLLLVLIAAWLCWVVWLERYVIYTSDGATIDFSLSAQIPQGEVAVPPSVGETVPIYYNEGDNTLDLNTELTQVWGYYIDENALKDVSGIIDKLNTLEPGTPIMVDVKNTNGAFLYSSSIPEAVPSSNVPVTSVDKLIEELTTRNFYVIARLPAFSDRNFGLNHVSSGIYHVSKQYLWSDGSYWLNPSNNTARTWILQIVEELKDMGFDEVVLSHFRIPEADGVYFTEDRNTVLQETAQYFIATCETDTFAVSIATTNAAFPLPEGRCRLYLESVAAQNVPARAAQVVISDPQTRLVFITEANDTRYNEYGVLRPLSASDVLEAQRAEAHQG